MRDDGVDHDEIERLAKIGSWVRDLEAGTLSWSRELRRIFGIDEDAPASFELLLSRMHPEDRAYMQREFGSLERRLDVDLIHCLRLVDGTEKYLHAKGRVVMGPNGRPARVLGTMQDITERVHADQEHERVLARLREREEILRHAVGIADLGIFVQLAGSIPARCEEIRHGGALPVLPDFSITMYVNDGPRAALTERLAGFMRQAYGGTSLRVAAE